ncbi:hypothetical protein ACTA71_009064 [Dictyostelium dimigraforme]
MEIGINPFPFHRKGDFNLVNVTPTKEECLTNLKKTMDLLLKLGFKLYLERGILEPTQSITFSLSTETSLSEREEKGLDQCSPRKLAGLKGKLIALKDAIIPFRLYTRQTNKFRTQCLTLANGDWDQSFPIPQEVKSETSIWLTVLNQWNGKEISLFPNFDYVLTTDASESGAGATLKKGNTIIKTWSLQWSSDQSTMSSNRREMLALLSAYQAIQQHHSRQGGQIQDLSILFEQLWKQCLKKKITLIGEHIPGFFNVRSDHLSRLSEMNHKTAKRIKSYNWRLKKKAGTSDLLMSSWQPSTLKVYDSSYAKFYSFCTSNNLDPSDITLQDLQISLKNLIVSTDSIKGPVINSKEQRNGNNNSNLSILELTSLDDDNSSVCPVRHPKSLPLASSKRRSTNSVGIPHKSNCSMFCYASYTLLFF